MSIRSLSFVPTALVALAAALPSGSFQTRSAAAVPVSSGPAAGRIVRKDHRFDLLVPKDAALVRVASGFSWVEGPLWDRGALFFSDIPKNVVMRLKEGATAEVAVKPSGYSGAAPFLGREPGSNGLALDPLGRLVLCQHGDRRIARRNDDGTLVALAERYEGRRLNSPNDLVYKSNGDLYFTDPPFGLPKWNEDPEKELPWSGVYRLDRAGRLTLLTKEVPFPNGIAFSPDKKTLYVSNADAKNAVWLAFDVAPDGTLHNKRVFFDATAWVPASKGLPDGMKVDEKGNLFAAGPGGLHVFAPDGTHLGSFETGVATSNCAWGEDGRTLFVTADAAILKVRLTTRSAGVPAGRLKSPVL